MKIKLTISPNNRTIPFDYQKILSGTFHKWLGKNNIHDTISLYSFSWLHGGIATKSGLDFKNGAFWTIGSHAYELLKNVVSGIQKDPSINSGMEVMEITIQNPPSFSNEERFLLDSPVFIKRNIGGKVKFFLYHDVESNHLLTETLVNKLDVAGMESKGVEVSFDRSYPNPKTKFIKYDGIGCRASICPVIVKGTPEQIAFAWNVGVGNSTGIGFGSLK